jgi:threonine/homoserine/homoserine lactone efflux protein
MTVIHASMAFFYGLGIGFANSIPFGPINLSIIETSFKKGFWHAFMIGLGALVIDILYCAIGVFGLSMAREYLEFLFLPLSFPVFMVLGGRLVQLGYRGNFEVPQAVANAREMSKHFSLGFVLYLANPLAVGFWVFVMGVLFTYELIRRTMTDQLSFVIGMAIGTGLYFFVLAKFVVWRRQRISTKTIRRISIGTGVALMAFGCYFGYLWYTTW